MGPSQRLLAGWANSFFQVVKTRPLIRETICDGLGFLGIELAMNGNAKNAGLISPYGSRLQVRVIRTEEELMIAQSVAQVLNLG